MLWSVRDLFSMAQAAQVYFKIYRQWQVSKSNNGVAVNYNPGLSIFIPSLGASRRNYCLLSPIGMKLPKIAKEQALIPYIKLGCFSDVLEGFPWVTLRGEKKERQSTETLQPSSGVDVSIWWIITKQIMYENANWTVRKVVRPKKSAARH